MLLVARCPLLAAHRMRRCLVSPVASRVLLHVVCCLLSVVCCMRCLLLAVFCAVFPACRMPPVDCCLVVCSPLHAVFATLSVVCCLHVARCMLCHMSWLFAACCTKFVLRCLFSGARPSVPCRMVCAVRRLSHLASRHVACAALRVAWCMLHVARPESHVVTCVLPVLSCMSSYHHACYPHARTPTSVCSRSRRPLRGSIASAAAGILAPEAGRRKGETVAACLRS
jgi:hypothetical protein